LKSQEFRIPKGPALPTPGTHTNERRKVWISKPERGCTEKRRCPAAAPAISDYCGLDGIAANSTTRIKHLPQHPLSCLANHSQHSVTSTQQPASSARINNPLLTPASLLQIAKPQQLLGLHPPRRRPGTSSVLSLQPFAMPSTCTSRLNSTIGCPQLTRCTARRSTTTACRGSTGARLEE